MNITQRPYNYYKSCPPNNQCSNRGKCLINDTLFYCKCSDGYGGLNCELTNQ